MVFALITAWTRWCMDDLGIIRLNNANAMLFTNLLLMNTILCPIVLTVLISRMCGMERMGNIYKWIYTMQKPECVYRGKAAAGSFYIILFALVQIFLLQVASRSHDGGVTPHLMKYFMTICLISLCVFILQLNLSFKFTNRLTPIFISIGGIFIGLFSWFLNGWPLRCLIPQEYYASLCNVGYTYDESTCYIACNWDTYSLFWMTVLVVAITILYRYGQKHFLETICETM